MRRAGTAGVAVVVVIGLAACGSSDDDGGDASGTQLPVETASAPSVVEPAEVTVAPETPPAGGGGGGEGTTTPPPEVGAVLLGTAVATVSGGDVPDEQTGDVKREDQRCYGVGTLAGLEVGAPVAVRDLATGASVGAGTIETTSAVQIRGSDDPPPLWDCTFQLRIELTATAGEVAVQIAGLPELIGDAADGNLSLIIPNDVTTTSEVSLPQVSEPELSLPGY